MYPTLTTVNASAFATGHGIGDTGDFANTAFVGLPPLPSGNPGRVPFYEDDAILGDMNQRYAPSYLDETTVLEAARKAGWQTAAIGKMGPVAIQDVTARDGEGTIVIDDATGNGWMTTPVPLAPDVARAMKAAGLGTTAPDRGLNTDPGSYIRSGVIRANVDQQTWFADVATKVLLPRFKAAGKPFVMVFWSRDPDGTQHNEGDSLNQLVPGINGPTSLKAVRNADDDLARLRAALKAQGLDKTTDIVVVADHGFTTISRQSATSGAARQKYLDVVPGFLPPGFLAIDLAKALDLKLNDSYGLPVRLADGFHPKDGSALLGDPAAQGRRQGAGAQDRPGAARPGLRVRRLRRRPAGLDSRNLADQRDRPSGRGPHAQAGHRRQLPELRHGLRRSRDVRGRGRRHHVAAGPGHARLAQPRRNAQLHGRGRPRLQSRLPRHRPRLQRRHRRDARAPAGPEDHAARQAHGAGRRGGAGQGPRPGRGQRARDRLRARPGRLRHRAARAGARWPCLL
jgi:hypothetical protein